MTVKPGGAWWILGMGAISTYGQKNIYPGPGDVPFDGFSIVPSAFFVDLMWIPPPPGSGLNTEVTYVIYRDDVAIAETSNTEYRDEGLALDTEYNYKIYSKNIYGVLSENPLEEDTRTLNVVTEPISLSHTAKGQFTITNYDPTVFYWVVKGNDPNGASGGTIDANGVITTNTATQDYTLFAARFQTDDRDMSLEIRFYRQARTWRSYGCTGQSNNPCGDCGGAGCPPPCGPPCSWSCGCVGGDSGGGAWGCCICRYGTTCTEENTYAGYTKRHDEWVRIEASEQPSTASVDLNPLPISAFTDAPFIHAFALGEQIDIAGDSLRGGDISPYTKFSNASIEVFDTNGELIDVISMGDNFRIEINDENKKCNATLISYQMPKGEGTFDLMVTDSLGEITHQEIGEWSNNG